MNHLERFFLFDRLGLRRNPFGTLTDEEWADIAIIPQEIQSAFDAGHHLQILGPRGRGKSTILRSLIRRIAWQQKQSAYVHLQRWQGHYHSDIRELDAFALDEAQRLLLWRWWPLLHRAQGGLRLIIGSHRDDRWLFSLFGLHVQTYWDGEIGRCHFRPRPEHTAFPGYVYGGLLASIIDCHSIGTAIAAMYDHAGREPGTKPEITCVTGNLNVSYKKPTPMGVPLVSDAIQGLFFSSGTDALVHRLRQAGMAVALSATACALPGARTQPWLVLALFASGTSLAVLVGYLVMRPPGRIINLVVRCEALVEDCVTAIRRAIGKHPIATSRGPRRQNAGDSGQPQAARRGRGARRIDRSAGG